MAQWYIHEFNFLSLFELRQTFMEYFKARSIVGAPIENLIKF